MSCSEMIYGSFMVMRKYPRKLLEYPDIFKRLQIFFVAAKIKYILFCTKISDECLFPVYPDRRRIRTYLMCIKQLPFNHTAYCRTRSGKLPAETIHASRGNTQSVPRYGIYKGTYPVVCNHSLAV